MKNALGNINTRTQIILASGYLLLTGVVAVFAPFPFMPIVFLPAVLVLVRQLIIRSRLYPKYIGWLSISVLSIIFSMLLYALVVAIAFFIFVPNFD